jgi:hypothetical protein
VIKQDILDYLKGHGPTRGMVMAWALECPDYTVDEVWCTALDMARQCAIVKTSINEYAVFSLYEGATN